MTNDQLYITLKKLAKKRKIEIHECKLPRVMYGVMVSASNNVAIFIDRDVSMFGYLIISSNAFEIYIDEDIPLFQKVLTLSHELGHFMIHRSLNKILNAIDDDPQFKENNSVDYNLLEHKANAYSERLISFIEFKGIS